MLPPIRLLILDVDGTLVTTRSGNPHRTAIGEMSSESDWKWIPHRRDALRAFLQGNPGCAVALATNQGGVAHGHHDAARMKAEIERLGGEIGEDVFVQIAFGMADAPVSDFRYDDPLRKPAPGALVAAIEHFDVSPQETMMVGDGEWDQAAAEAAGCHFMWADDFFAVIARVPIGAGLE